MERRGDEVPLPCGDALVSVRCEGPASPPGPHDRRSADEHASERAVEPLDREIDLERLPLPSEGVPVHGHVHEPQEVRLVRHLFDIYRTYRATGVEYSRTVYNARVLRVPAAS